MHQHFSDFCVNHMGQQPAQYVYYTWGICRDCGILPSDDNVHQSLIGFVAGHLFPRVWLTHLPLLCCTWQWLHRSILCHNPSSQHCGSEESKQNLMCRLVSKRWVICISGILQVGKMALVSNWSISESISHFHSLKMVTLYHSTGYFNISGKLSPHSSRKWTQWG